MKKYILLFLVAYITNFGFAQAPPQGINYQAVVYSDNGDNQPGLNVSGQVLRNKNIRVRYTIIQNATNGTEVYKEAHTTTTDAFGMFSLVIGQGVQEGSNAFVNINWGSGKHFLKVEIDKRGGTNYVMMSNQQLLSVPYALYADKSTYSTTSGNGIVSVSDNGNGTLTFTYFDGSTYTSPVLTGLQGPQGIQGPAGQNGINGVNGTNGQNGLSAYEIWLSQGNTGTEQDFLTALTGAQGAQGIQGVAGQNGTNGSNGSNGSNGKNTLVKTTTESAGSNCTSGGMKIEYGLDANSNGVLDVSEVNAPLTKYVCNGASATNNILSPTIVTNSVTNITSNSATFSGSISGVNSSQIFERGFVYGTSSLPNINSLKIIVGAGTGNFNYGTIASCNSTTFLTYNTTYYLRTYVITENNVVIYGNEVTFTTLNVGQTGQAGGIVFYDKGVFSNGWRYIEVMPIDHVGGMVTWGYCNGIYVSGTSTSIGAGQNNTNLICNTITSCTSGSPTFSNFAALQCNNLDYNNYSDWFLPSRDELNVCLMNLQTNNLAGLNNLGLWSSSMVTENNTNAYMNCGSASMVGYYYVRAVRYY